MGSVNASNEIELVLELLADLGRIEDLGVELDALLGVLEYAGHLDGARPVDVVEALAVDELLQDALLHLGVIVDDLVVVGDGGAPVGELRHHEEVVVVADHILGDDGARGHVLHRSALGVEESLVRLRVDQHHRDVGLAHGVDLLQLLQQGLDHVLVVQGYLVVGAAVGEDDHLLGGLLVALEVGVHQLQHDAHHADHLAVDVRVDVHLRANGTEGRVDGCYAC